MYVLFIKETLTPELLSHLVKHGCLRRISELPPMGIKRVLKEFAYDTSHIYKAVDRICLS
jgi:hypothetical protein